MVSRVEVVPVLTISEKYSSHQKDPAALALPGLFEMAHDENDKFDLL